MIDDRPGTDAWISFTQERGGSWVNWDNRFWLWVGNRLTFLGGVGVMGFGTVVYSFLKFARGKRKAVRISQGVIGKKRGVKGMDNV